ncbi:hypothetical protein ACFL3T_00460 [Patescibacteria group bacterium]
MSEIQKSDEEHTFKNEEVQVYYETIKDWPFEELIKITRTETNPDYVDAAWMRIRELEESGIN